MLVQTFIYEVFLKDLLLRKRLYSQNINSQKIFLTKYIYDNWFKHKYFEYLFNNLIIWNKRLFLILHGFHFIWAFISNEVYFTNYRNLSFSTISLFIKLFLCFLLK